MNLFCSLIDHIAIDVIRPKIIGKIAAVVKIFIASFSSFVDDSARSSLNVAIVAIIPTV